MGKYYKLYNLDNSKLFSTFGGGKYIELDKVYQADDSHYKLCFSGIDNILDYKEEHGIVVCDIEPVGNTTNSVPGMSRIESECESIIARNPRSIYSPEFIQELITNGSSQGAWNYVSDESHVNGAIEHMNDGSCYNVSLDYDLSKSLKLLLLDVYDNKELNKWFDYRRPRFNYEYIFRRVKNDRKSRNVVLDAWNKYAPCKKSRRLKKLNFLFGMI